MLSPTVELTMQASTEMRIAGAPIRRNAHSVAVKVAKPRKCSAPTQLHEVLSVYFGARAQFEHARSTFDEMGATGLLVDAEQELALIATRTG